MSNKYLHIDILSSAKYQFSFIPEIYFPIPRKMFS